MGCCDVLAPLGRGEPERGHDSVDSGWARRSADSASNCPGQIVTRSLPDGFVVRLSPQVRVEDGGAALIGGSPTRAVYLRPAAQSMLIDGTLTVTSIGTDALAQRLLDAGMVAPVLDALPAVALDSITVVVPAYDRHDALARLLASIGRTVPVIVVDDCSRDAAAMASVATAHGATLIRLDTNVGPAGARNAGLAAVTTPFVAFVDSDMVLDPDVLPRLLRHFADPSLSLVAPRIMGMEEDRANWIGRYEDARSSLDMGRRASLVRPLSPLSWLPAACMVARVADIGAGFGEGMRVAEDVDLVWRLAEQGRRVRYEPSVRARHEHRSSLTDWLGRKAFYGTGADLLAQRHPRNIAPAVLAPWTVALLAALLAQRRWSLPAAGALTIAAAIRISRRLPRSRHPLRVAVRLTATGVVSAVFQATALLLRHWWPLTAVLCLLSRRMRRAVVAAALLDTAMEYSRTRPKLDPVRFALLRRLDDIAYGSGVWLSAWRGRSLRALLPDVSGGRRRRTVQHPPGR